MKNIFKSLLLPALALVAIPLMTSCENDDDSNPTIQYPTSFVLNTPAYATSNIYDLSKTETVTLTCSQPDYGYPAITIYEVQVAIDQSFATYTTLETSYTTAKMDLDGVELNNTIVNLYQQANGGADPSGVIFPIYIRLQAHVSGTDNTYCYSNTISLSKVAVSYVATVPSTVYVAGSSIHGGTSAKTFAPTYGFDGQFYAMAYLTSGSTFFWGDSAEPTNGYSLTTTIDDEAGAGISAGSDGGIQVSNTDWYVLYLSLDVANNQLISSLTVYPASAYVIGEIEGGNWIDEDADWAMTKPADASSQWVSPAFIAGGELRAYIKVPDIDWWRTEFTLYNGNLFWRTVDIANNWAENVGSAYSVTCETGQKLYVDFDYDTGEVK
ncbi:MAG: SusE domain-containing protein [Prevotella sp.]|nr:SusE domain-containing protein [Prevotella sp.]